MKQQNKFKETEIGNIPEEWEVVKTDEVILPEKGAIKIGPFGSQLKKEFLVSEGYKVYGQENVFKNDFLLGHRYLTKERFDLLSSCELKPGDFLMSMMGTIGFVAIVPQNIQKGIMDSHLLRLRIDESKFNKKFLLYAFRSRFIQNQLDCLSVGCIMAGLSSGVIKKLIFPKPKLTEQSAIAKILSDLDEQIELNQQMNKSLEAIGQALFKHWFIDFEFPDEKGKPYRSSGGKMVDSELGEIPQRWVVGTLGDICDITMGQSPPGHSYNEDGSGLPFYQGISDFGFRFPSRRVYCTAPTRFAEEGDVLLSVRAPVGAFNVAEERCAIGRGLAALRLKEKHNGFLYYLLRATRSEWEKFEAEGTVFGSVTKSDVHNFKVVVPPQPLLARFALLTEGLEGKINIDEKQSRTLSAIRDSLLPKLMSGQIRVPVG